MFAHTLSALPIGHTGSTASLRRGLRRSWERLCEALCGLRGHETLLRREPDRLFLECTTCGHQSAGWQLGGHAQSKEFTRGRGLSRTRPVPRGIAAASLWPQGSQ